MTERAVSACGDDASSEASDELSLAVSETLAAVHSCYATSYSTGLVRKDGSPSETLSTFAGSPQAVTHHLDASCEDLRARRTVSFKWRTPGMYNVGYPQDTSLFAGTLRLCASCAERFTGAAALLGVSILYVAFQKVRTAAYCLDETHGSGRSAHDAAAGVLEASRLLEGFKSQPIPYLPDVCDAVEAAIAAAENALRVSVEMYRRSPPKLPEGELLDLLAASCARPVSAFRSDPNPAGRTLHALREPPGMLLAGEEGMLPDPRTIFAVSQLFDRWYKEVSVSGTNVRWGRERAEAFAASDMKQLSAASAVNALDVWAIAPDAALSPRELVEANWRAAAGREAEQLFEDWYERLEGLLACPPGDCLVLMHAPQDIRLIDLEDLDRYGCAKRVLRTYPLDPASTSGMYLAAVPVVVARAMDGYSSAGDPDERIEIASLEGVLEDSVSAVVETAAALAGSSRAAGWLATSVSIAKGVVL